MIHVPDIEETFRLMTFEREGVPGVRWFARLLDGGPPRGGIAGSAGELIEVARTSEAGWNVYVQLNPAPRVRGFRASAADVTAS